MRVEETKVLEAAFGESRAVESSAEEETRDGGSNEGRRSLGGVRR